MAGGNGGDPGFSRNAGGGFHYQSQVDPEELFRTIFGDAFRQGRDFESMFDRYNDNEQYEIAQVD